MWRNCNSCALLVGLQIGVAAVENSLVVSESETKLSHDPAIPLLGTGSKDWKQV